MGCDCDSCKDDMVLINRDSLKGMLALLSEQVPVTQTPTFTPNKSIGEGIASERELEYRKELLELVEQFYYYIEGVLSGSFSSEEKKKLVDGAVTTFIKEGKELVELSIQHIYETATENAQKLLREMGLTVETGKPDPSRINALIEQQKDNIDSLAYRIRGQVFQQINLNKLEGYYGS